MACAYTAFRGEPGNLALGRRIARIVIYPFA